MKAEGAGNPVTGINRDAERVSGSYLRN